MFRLHNAEEEKIERLRRELVAIEREFMELKRDLLACKDWREQPRVSAGNSDGGQWTTDDPDTTGGIGRLLPAARRLLRPGADPRRAVGGALTQYAIGSSRNGPNRQTIAEFNARAFAREGLDVGQ